MLLQNILKTMACRIFPWNIKYFRPTNPAPTKRGEGRVMQEMLKLPKDKHIVYWHLHRFLVNGHRLADYPSIIRDWLANFTNRSDFNQWVAGTLFHPITGSFQLVASATHRFESHVTTACFLIPWHDMPHGKWSVCSLWAKQCIQSWLLVLSDMAITFLASSFVQSLLDTHRI